MRFRCLIGIHTWYMNRIWYENKHIYKYQCHYCDMMEKATKKDWIKFGGKCLDCGKNII